MVVITWLTVFLALADILFSLFLERASVKLFRIWESGSVDASKYYFYPNSSGSHFV